MERKKHLTAKYIFWLKHEGIIPDTIVRQFKADVESLKSNYDRSKGISF